MRQLTQKEEFAIFMKDLGYEEELPSLDESKLSTLRNEIVQQCGDDKNCKKQEFLELVRNFKELNQQPQEQRDLLIMQLLALWLELDLTVANIQEELNKLKEAVGNSEKLPQEENTDKKNIEEGDFSKYKKLSQDNGADKESIGENFSNPFFDKTVLKELNEGVTSPEEVLFYAVDVVLSKPEYQQSFVKMIQDPKLVEACEGDINCVFENALLAGFANKDGSINNNYIALEKAIKRIDKLQKEKILDTLYESVAIANAVDDIMVAYLENFSKSQYQVNDSSDWKDVVKNEGVVGVIKKTYGIIQNWVKKGLKWTGLKDVNANKWSEWIVLGGVVLGAWIVVRKAVMPFIRKGWDKFTSRPFRMKALAGVGLWFGKDVANDNGLTLDWFKTLLFGEKDERMEIEEDSPEGKIFYLDSVVVAILPSDKSIKELKDEGYIIFNSQTEEYEVDWNKIKDHPLMRTLIRTRYKGNKEEFKKDFNQSIDSLLKFVSQNELFTEKNRLKDIVAWKWKMSGDLKMMVSPSQWSKLKERGLSSQLKNIIWEFEKGEITFKEAEKGIQQLLDELENNDNGNGINDDEPSPSNGGNGVIFNHQSSMGGGLTSGIAATVEKGNSQGSSTGKSQTEVVASSKGGFQKQTQKTEGVEDTGIDKLNGDKLNGEYEKIVVYLDNMLENCECYDKDRVKFLASIYVFIPFLQGQLNEEQAKVILKEIVLSAESDNMYLTQEDLNSLVYSLQSPDFMDFDYVSVDSTLRDEQPLPISVVTKLEKLDKSGELVKEVNISLIYSQTINVVLENFGQHLLEDERYKKKLEELREAKRTLYQATDGLLKVMGKKDENDKIQQNLAEFEKTLKEYNEKLKSLALYVIFHSTLDSDKKYYLGVEFIKKLADQKEISSVDWLRVIEILDDLQYGLFYASSLVETSMLSSLDHGKDETTEILKKQEDIIKYLDKVACQRHGEGCENVNIDKRLFDLNKVPQSVIDYVIENVKFMKFSLAELVNSGVVTKYTIEFAIVRGFPEIWKIFKELKNVDEPKLKWSDLENEEKIALFEAVLGSRIAVEIIKSAMKYEKRKKQFWALIDSKYPSHEAGILKSYFEWLYKKIQKKNRDDMWNIVKSLTGMTILILAGWGIGAIVGGIAGAATTFALRAGKISRLAYRFAQLIKWEKWGGYGKMLINARNMGYAISFTYLNEPLQYALEKDFGKSWEAVEKSFSKEYGWEYLKDFLGETAFLGLLEAAYPLATYITKGFSRGQKITRNAFALGIGGGGYLGINLIVDGEPPSFEEALNAAMILLLLGRMGSLPETRKGLKLKFTKEGVFLDGKALNTLLPLKKQSKETIDNMSVALALGEAKKGLRGGSTIIISKGGKDVKIPRNFEGLGGVYKFSWIDPETGQRVVKKFSVEEVFRSSLDNLDPIEKSIINTMRGSGENGIKLYLPKGALGLTRVETNRRIELAKSGKVEEIFKIEGGKIKLEIKKGSKKLRFQIEKTSSNGGSYWKDISLAELRKELGDKRYLEFIEKLKTRSIAKGLLEVGDSVRFKTINGEKIELKKTENGNVEVRYGTKKKTFNNEEEALNFLWQEGKGLSIVEAYLKDIGALDKNIRDTLTPVAKKSLEWAKDELKVTWKQLLKLLQKAKNNGRIIADGIALASIPIGDRYFGGGFDEGADNFGILAGTGSSLLAPRGKRILTFFIVYSIVQGIDAWKRANQEHDAY